MRIHAAPDTATMIKEYVGGEKVRVEGNTVENKEEASGRDKETSPVASTSNEKKANKELNVYLMFSVDEETGEHVVRVLDPETGDVIRQFPPEEFLQVVKNMRNLKGVLFSARL
jgi:flagellar protein FlaG